MKATITITIEIEENKNSLSDCDKEQIKQAILQGAANRPYYPLNRFADEVIDVIKKINSQTS